MSQPCSPSMTQLSMGGVKKLSSVGVYDPVAFHECSILWNRDWSKNTYRITYDHISKKCNNGHAPPPPTQWPPGWFYDMFLVKDPPPFAFTFHRWTLDDTVIYCWWYGGTHTPGAGCVIHQHSTHPIQKVNIVSSLLDFVFVHALEPQHLLSKVAHTKKRAEFSIFLNVHPWKINIWNIQITHEKKGKRSEPNPYDYVPC